MSTAIVGIGLVTALGRDVPTTWDALIAGKSGVRPIRRFDASTFPVTFAAEVEHALDGPDLYDWMLDHVLDQALQGVDLSGVAPERLGVWLGSEAVRPSLQGIADSLHHKTMPDPADIAKFHPARPAVRTAIRVGARGPVHTLSIACTSSAQALGGAVHAIRRGEVDVAIAGGVDILVHPFMVMGFSRLGALSTRNGDPAAASRPFDQGRDGFVLGDGAGMLVLASERVAERIGPILGRITGYASTSNAWRITDTPPDGRGTRVAIEQALRDAGRRPEDVAYVNAHGTSTPQNDASEAAALQAVFGEHTATTPVSSTKSMTGHTVAACGAVEAIITLRAITTQIAPPTINLDNPDRDCNLCHIPWTARDIRRGIGISNSAGFGGSNATLILETP